MHTQVVAAAAAVAVGLALWTGSSRRPQGQSTRSSKGVPVTFNLDGASKSWLAKNMVTHGFADISRAARMAIDYVAQEGVPAEVFASARVAAKTSVGGEEGEGGGEERDWVGVQVVKAGFVIKSGWAGLRSASSSRDGRTEDVGKSDTPDARFGNRMQRLEAGDVELVLDRAQLDWLERMVTEHVGTAAILEPQFQRHACLTWRERMWGGLGQQSLADRNHALAVAFDFAQRADSALIFRIDRSKTRGPRNPSVRFTIKS